MSTRGSIEMNTQLHQMKSPLMPSQTAASGLLQRKCACGTHTMGGECEECKSNKVLLQRASLSSRGRGIEGEAEAPPLVHEVLRSPGQPLGAATRAYMEPRFGHDFSQVRVHTDAKAAESARAVNALAYTVGPDVVFDAGQYRPTSRAGQRLLAHELCHVVQQSAPTVARGMPGRLRVGDRHDPLEHEADALAYAALSRQPADEHLEARTQSGPVENPVLRKKDDPESKGEEAESNEPPKATPSEKPEGAAAQPATQPCDPQGLSRADYLKQSGTSTDDFGLTRLSGTVGVPAVSASPAGKGKTGVTLDPTDAIFPPLTSVFTKANTFIEGEGIFIGEQAECPSGKKYPLKWTIDGTGAQKLREAELEHCADYKYAFEISLRRYADAVNDLSKKKMTFASQKAAANYVTKFVGPAPDTWYDKFKCLLDKSQKARDGTKATPGSHTPRPFKIPPRLQNNCEFARAIVSASSLPQVGKVRSPDIIKDCAEGPPAKAKGGAKPGGEKATSLPAPRVEGKAGRELFPPGNLPVDGNELGSGEGLPPGRHGSTLPYREATELAKCIEIMGEENAAFCRAQVLHEKPAPTPSIPCTPAEAKRLAKQVGDARAAALPFVKSARVALDRLHSRWIDFKADLIAGTRSLIGEVACAFNSNFNITPRNPDYGVRQIHVMSRLKGLESRMSKPVGTECQPSGDPQCSGRNRDTVAFVVGGQPPIHFCAQFRDDPDEVSQQTTVVHEFAHLLPGVGDEGGYALGGLLGAQATTCNVGLKFKADSEILANTADALAGFVMHIGQTGATDLKVK